MDRERKEGPVARGITGQGIEQCLRHFTIRARLMTDFPIR